ncbi:MAG TPA: hypothetical protein VGQ09_00245 [Chitinophagaceae bacterium]|nr:hypothetical protein [Chitinophagaceae bacterium]
MISKHSYDLPFVKTSTVVLNDATNPTAKLPIQNSQLQNSTRKGSFSALALMQETNMVSKIKTATMKKIAIVMISIAFAVASFGQQNAQKPPLTKTDYLQKSKKQKKAATILLISGAALVATSFIIPRGEMEDPGICVGAYCDDKYKNDGIKSAFFIAGGTTALSSIPFFIISGKNRRKAMSLGFKMDKIISLCNQNFVYNSHPALGVKINF